MKWPWVMRSQLDEARAEITELKQARSAMVNRLARTFGVGQVLAVVWEFTDDKTMMSFGNSAQNISMGPAAQEPTQAQAAMPTMRRRVTFEEIEASWNEAVANGEVSLGTEAKAH